MAAYRAGCQTPPPPLPEPPPITFLQGCLAGWLPDAAAAAPAEVPSADAVVLAWRRAVLAVAPLASCCSLPPQHIGNFTEYAAHRWARGPRGAAEEGRRRGRAGGGGGGVGLRDAEQPAWACEPQGR